MRTRTPTILQMQPVDGGVVAVAILLAHHGRREPMHVLRKAAGLTSAGVDVEGLVACAESFGLEGEIGTAAANELGTTPGPAIIGWGRKDVVVLEGRDGRGWWINDPAKGARVVADDDFQRSFNGTVIRFRPGPDFRRGGSGPSLLRSLRRALRGCGGAVLAAIVASITLVPVQLAGAGLITFLVDVVLVDRRTDRIPPFLLAASIIYAVRSMLMFIQSQANNRIGIAASVQLQSRLVRHAVHLPEPERSLRTPADIQQRLTTARIMATNSLKTLTLLPSNLVTIIVFGAAVVLISRWVALAMAVSIPVGFLLTKIVASRVYALRMQNEVALGQQRTTIYTALGIRDWLLEAGGLRPLLDLWLGHLSHASNLSQRSGGIQLHATVGRGLVNQLVTQVGTLVLGGLGVIGGSITLGELAALQFLTGTLQVSVTAVLNVAQSLPLLRTSLARVDDILDVPIEDRPEAAPQSAAVSGEAIVLRGIPAGEDRVLAGELASGGLGVVRGLDELEADRLAGEIAADQRRRGRSVRVLSGKVHLHPGGLGENVAGFDPRVSASDVTNALLSAGLGPLVKRQAAGVTTSVREDRPIGDPDEDARLEIATVLVDPPTLVVARRGLGVLPTDEANALLDRIRGTGAAVLVLDPRVEVENRASEIHLRPRGEVPS
jgi:ABC-type bacteriocin/lantibiotic exporter with double-glycine peptidase domain